MRKKVRSAYLLESLEARLLFSADLAPLPVDGGTTGAEFESDLEISLQPDGSGVQEAKENTQERQEVIFVDSGVDDYQQLIDDIESQLEKGRQFDIVNLESDSDGIDQISAYLKQHEGIDAVHVVSHGSEDAVKLGNVWLTPDKLDAYADAIEGWQQALSNDADLLFYGCNLAADDGGQDLVNSLTLLTGADVAASDDVTGNAKFGGDWVLEYKSGEIEASVPFSVDLQANWSGLLNTFTVTTTTDGGAGSLRQAIIDANTLGGSHTIILGADTYTLTITGAGENAAATGDLDITADITITGVDAASTIIDASGFGGTPDRVFHIRSGATLDISGVTIQGGDQNNSGGIFVDNSSTLHLSDAILQNNTSTRGGAIHVHGTANLDRVLLYNNSATDPGPGDGQGGAIHFHGADGGTLTNVTISGNSAEDAGGGLWTDSVITVTNCTITLNDAPNGGGIVNSGGTVNISNTIVAENSASSDSDVQGAFNSQGNNLIGDEDGATGFTDGVSGDQVGTTGSPIDPLLDSLRDNGGFTLTHLPLGGSPAVDAGTATGPPMVDQRGIARPLDGDGDTTAAVDIGAVEVVPDKLVHVADLLNDQETSHENRGSHQAVAMAANGNYVVVWSSDNEDGSGWGVFGQRFDASGTAVGSKFQVNDTFNDNQRWATVAMDAAGNFVVVWTSENQDGTSHSVYARGFNADATEAFAEFRVNTYATDVQKNPSIAMASDGRFVIAWEGAGLSVTHGILFRRFNADGSARDAADLVANGFDLGMETTPAVAINDAGDFAIAWEVNNDIYVRPFGDNGLPVRFEDMVNLFSNSTVPDVAIDATGRITVVFRSENATHDGIWMRTYASNGIPGAPVQVDQNPSEDSTNPSITMDSAGNRIIVFEESPDGDGIGVFARKYDAGGTPLGDPFQINQTTTGTQHMASAAMFDIDNFVVVWSGIGPDDSNGVFTRHFGAVTNDAPTATNLTSTSSYNEGDASVDITDIVVTDNDSGEMITATLTLNDTATGSLSANDGATYDSGTGIWKIMDTVANVNLALANVVFLPNSDNDVDTTIDVSLDDDDEDGSGPLTGTITLDVTPINDAPTINSAAGYGVNEDDNYRPMGATISIDDVDAGGADVEVTLGVINGVLLIGSVAGLTSITGNDSTSVVLVGSIVDINVALASVNYKPNPNYSGSDTFSIAVDDLGNTGTGGPKVANKIVPITVNAVNDVPVATGNTVITSEDVPLVIGPGDFNFTDVEGDSLVSVTISGLNLNGGTLTHSGGAVTVTNGMTITAAQLADLTFTPALNDSTNCSFTYTVNDAGSGVTSAVMNITVNAVNDVPVATGNTVIASEDVPLVIGPGDFNFTDVEGDSLVSVTIAGLNLNGGTLTHSAGAVTVTNGMTITAAQLADLTFTSALNDSTNSSFTYTVNDAGTGVTSAVMNITVNAVNDVPVATGNTVIANEDVPLVIGPGDFNFTDVEGDSLASVTITGLNLNGGTLTHSAGAVTVTNGMTITAAQLADLTFTSALNDSTNSSFTYTVNDAGTGVTPAVMNITVNAVNDVPVATGNTVIASEDVPLVIGPGDFNFTDTEGDSLVSVTITGLILNGGTLTHSAGAVTVTNGMTITAAELADLTFTSALNDSTDCSFTYTVDDAGTGVTSAVMNITVNAVNDAGTVTIDNTTPAQGDTLTANVIDTDGASGAINFQWFNDGAVIGGATGKTYITTQADVNAIMTVTAIYTDDQGTAESLISAPTAPVTNVNDTPIAVNDNLTATEDQSMTFTSVTDLLANDSDIDGDTLTVSSFSQPTNGSLDDNGDGTVTYTSANNFSGVDSFTYTISDSNGGTAAGAAIIVVTPVGDTPQVTNVSTDAGVQSGLINIDRNANDGAEVTHFIISGITNGTLYLADGVTRIDNGDFITVGQGQTGLRFTPAANSSADGSFNVESSEDGVSVASQSGIATSIISILTTAPPPAETAPSLSPSVPEEVVSEETEQEESKDLEDVAEETDVQAIADDMASVEAPQNAKAPSLKKASVVPGISVFKRADLDSNKDRTPGRSTLFSPQTLKKLVESENLGELKTALGKLDITTLPPDVYQLVRGSLDAVQEEIGNEILIGKTVVGSAIATSVGLSAGYVVWMLKGGSLMASVLSSLPAWQLADPLAILVGTKDDEDEDEDDDTLETIIKDGSRRNEDKKSKTSELDKHKKESTKR